MSKTVVGLFNSTSAAQQVKQALVSQGYEANNIRVMANDHDDGDTMTGSSTTTGYASGADTSRGTGTGTSIGQKISNFFHSLTGGDEDVHSHYASGVNEGGALLTVTTEDGRANEVASLLRQHGAREIEGGNRQTTGSVAGSDAYDSTSGRMRDDRSANLTGETSIPVVEEELVVGKREVDRGGVRIYSHVVERPAEADVTLRDERVNVERRAANRPATPADFEAGNGGSYELRASGEEAVVGKNSRVVEEVRVGKESSERNEAIRDTVRKTEVEVENLAGEVTTDKNRY